MQIGVDGRSLLEHHPSGISTYAFHVIHAMAVTEPHTEFVVFTSGKQEVTPALLQQLLELPNVSRKHLRMPNKIFHSLGALGLSPKIDKILDTIDVLFAPNMHVMPLSTSSVPLVLTVHDLSFKLFPQCLSKKRKLWHAAVRPKQLFERASNLIAVSNSTKNDVVHEYGIEDTKVHTIYSGIPQFVQPEPFMSLPDRFALMLSTVEPRKNIEAVINGYTKYAKQVDNPLHLVIIGSPGWKSERSIAAMKQHPTIHYSGYVSPQHKQYILERARFLLYPSLYEGFGFPPLEALRSDVPVVASRVGALPEVLKSAAYYIDPYSVDDITKSFSIMDSDAALRKQLMNKARNVLEHYSWSDTARRTLKVLRGSV